MRSKSVSYWVLAFLIMLLSFYLGSMLPYGIEAYRNNAGEIVARLIPVSQLNELAKMVSQYVWGYLALIPLIISLLALATVSAITLYFRVYKVEEE